MRNKGEVARVSDEDHRVSVFIPRTFSHYSSIPRGELVAS